MVGRDGVAGDRVQQVVEAEVGHGDGLAHPLDPEMAVVYVQVQT